uniref:Uncharacterized protein n=1 Tax=Fusarium ananatum TaxID=545334 RepID=A0A6M4B0Y9_9HYPO|nr:hypothetical protein [Fusarium ananatum]
MEILFKLHKEPNKIYPGEELLFHSPPPIKLFEQMAINESWVNKCDYRGFSARSHYNLTLKQEKELAGELENDSSTCDRYTFGLRWTQDKGNQITQPCIYKKYSYNLAISDPYMLGVAIKYERAKYNNINT